MEDLRRPEIFAEYYRMVYQDMYRFALYTLKNPHDAEDVTGEAVMDAYASVDKLRDPEAFRAWIFTILSNKCKRKLKEYADKTAELPEQLASRGKYGGGSTGSSGIRAACRGRQDADSYEGVRGLQEP